MNLIHPQTAFFVVGLLYIALPITAWTVLFKRHDHIAVAMWCLGGLLYGMAFLLIGLREVVSPWLSFVVANPLAFASYVVRGMALRHELGKRSRITLAVLLWALLSTAYLLAYAISTLEAPRLLVSLCVSLAGALGLAVLSRSLYLKQGYRSAGMLAVAYAVFACVIGIRMITVCVNWSEARAMTGGLDFLLTFLGAILAALYGNLGYIGIALESSRSKELERTAELAREQERAIQIQQNLVRQTALLEERGLLLAQRDEMLAALAHEVRQPLNNASAALQSAASVISGEPGSHQLTLTRLQRANSVLSQVTSALDNTLADAVLLSGQAPLTRQEIDVDTFVDLVIADIDPNIRHRVQCDRATSTRTVSMHAGLMRLALRNLITNALAYSPSDAPVVIHIADLNEPLALLIEVRDLGPGISEDLKPSIFKRGVRGKVFNNNFGHGLGLHIVKRVMDMHGGEVRLRQNEPSGQIMALVIPQEFAG